MCEYKACNSSQKCLITKLDAKISNTKVRPKLHLEIQSSFFLFLFLCEAGGGGGVRVGGIESGGERGEDEEGSRGYVKP